MVENENDLKSRCCGFCNSPFWKTFLQVEEILPSHFHLIFLGMKIVRKNERSDDIARVWQKKMFEVFCLKTQPIGIAVSKWLAWEKKIHRQRSQFHSLGIFSIIPPMWKQPFFSTFAQFNQHFYGWLRRDYLFSTGKGNDPSANLHDDGLPRLKKPAVELWENRKGC